MLALPLLLSACGGDDVPPAETYQEMHFDYLPKIKLNVGNILIEDHAHPLGPTDLASQSPLNPALGLARMAHDRLFAAGFNGTATFIIDQASIIQQPNGTLSGTLAVHLEVNVPGALQTGFAAAQVQRQHIPGSEPENLQNNLYDLTRQMLDAMNIEFEFQVKKNLSPALQTDAVTPAPVQTQPLDAAPPPQEVPPTPAPETSSVSPESAPAAPPAAPAAKPPPVSKYQDPLSPSLTAPPPAPPRETPPPAAMSPPPGSLQPPPGADDGY